MPSMVSGRVGVRGNKTHLVFRDKVGANDRGLSLRPHESRLPPGHFTVALIVIGVVVRLDGVIQYARHLLVTRQQPPPRPSPASGRGSPDSVCDSSATP
jgi:hypothetical protein